VRSAADVVVALALGARACLLGRPVMWALAADGERGVAAMLAMLRADLARTLTLMGVERVSDLGRDHLVAAAATSPHADRA
jgi:isopentenyl diphosphate isomerase/L-lactate dehydrogenase-like FMN-dependent dehydrogenase